ncbi:hypothetical protein GCM10010282_14570 [Streptomyces roseolus]|nr:hypothetical protein GCM10010282_14570 [Streptomyces roseolus]
MPHGLLGPELRGPEQQLAGEGRAAQGAGREHGKRVHAGTLPPVEDGSRPPSPEEGAWDGAAGAGGQDHRGDGLPAAPGAPGAPGDTIPTHIS